MHMLTKPNNRPTARSFAFNQTKKPIPAVKKKATKADSA
jgi:hypothetical protein